jgi:transcriptional repressor NrdR
LCHPNYLKIKNLWEEFEMTEVKKRLRHTEAFDPNKIRRSIQKAVLDADYTLDEKKELIDEFSIAIRKKSKEQREIDSESIRNSILLKIEKNTAFYCPIMAKI